MPDRTVVLRGEGRESVGPPRAHLPDVGLVGQSRRPAIPRDVVHEGVGHRRVAHRGAAHESGADRQELRPGEDRQMAVPQGGVQTAARQVAALEAPRPVRRPQCLQAAVREVVGGAAPAFRALHADQRTRRSSHR